MANKFHGNIKDIGDNNASGGKGASNGTRGKPTTGTPMRTYPWKDPGSHQKGNRSAGVKKLKSANGFVSKGV